MWLFANSIDQSTGALRPRDAGVFARSSTMVPLPRLHRSARVAAAHAAARVATRRRRRRVGRAAVPLRRHVAIALDECKREYDAVFYQDESLKMSGDVRCAGIDGCDVTLRLVGMFWHSRRVVFDLAANYLQARIPEIADVMPFSDANLDDARTQAPDFNGDRQEIERLGHEPWDAVTIRHRPGLTFTGYNVY